ncbi:hypothetical protein LCGC14_2308520, partial [marine sediment metagenome]
LYLCPSCSKSGSQEGSVPQNHSPEYAKLSKDKDPDDLQATDGDISHGVGKDLGSDIPLSDKVGKYGAYEGKDVAEAVRKLKEELYYNDLKEKVDKIFGEFK